MTTLITGAGMVGSLAAARLIRERGERPVLFDVGFSMQNLAERVPLDQVTLVRGDLTDVTDLVAAIQKHKVSHVIHTAGFLTWMVRDRPVAGARVNLFGTLNVLEAARLTGVERVVFCSSTAIYRGLSDAPGGVLSEDVSLRLVSEYPPSVYASLKLAGEWLGHCYRDEYGVDTVSLRFAGVFGPWYGTPSGGPSQLIQRIVESAHKGQPVKVTAGEMERGKSGYLHASDAAQGTVRAAYAARPASQVFNISQEKLYTVPEIVDLVQEMAGTEVKLDVAAGKGVSGYDKPVFPFDLTRARNELGWTEEFPMEVAVKDYLAWLDRQSPVGTPR